MPLSGELNFKGVAQQVEPIGKVVAAKTAEELGRGVEDAMAAFETRRGARRDVSSSS